MTRQQKIILAILATLNVILIGAMGTYVVVATRRDRRLEEIPLPVTDPCVTAVLEALSDPAGATFVDWSPAAAHIDVSTSALAPPAGAATEAPPAELIWDLLDRLPPDLTNHCVTPTTLSLVVRTGPPQRRTQTAMLPGTALMQWLGGELSDDDLAAETQYRVASAVTP